MTKIRANQTEIEEILNDPSAAANTTKKGSVEIATQTEVDAGVDILRVITPNTLKNFTGTFEPADATILKDADIGVTVQGYDATILNAADIGVTVAAFGHSHSHTTLTDIGTNTHAQIDTHISDGTIHFTKSSINLNDLGDVVFGSPVTDQVLTYDGVNWINSAQIGAFTLDANNTLFAGSGAGASLTTGAGHFLAGLNAGTAMTSGNANIAIGELSLSSVAASVSDCIAIGRKALRDITTSNNIGIGSSAGYRMSGTSNRNLVIGVLAGLGLYGTGNVDNIILGTSAGGTAGNTTTTAIGNVGVGHFALRNITGADNNVALGESAGSAITTGHENIAIGFHADVGTTSNDNITIGRWAGQQITTGAYNVNIGSYSGYSTNQSNKLSIHSSTAQTNTPLIGGDFSLGTVVINGTLTVTGGVDALTSATTVIDVSSATAPTAGQVLTATNGTAATWETPTGGSGGSPVITVLDDLADVIIGGSPLLTGHVLTYDGSSWINQTPASGVTDHTLLSNIGTNTHAQIDTHISDATIHFTTIDGLSDVIMGSPLLSGHTLTYDGVNWINQTPDSGVIDHLLLSNIGTNTHTQIDTHISDTTVHFTTLDGLGDVVVAGSPAVTNQVLTFNGTNWVNAAAQVGATKNWLIANNNNDFGIAPTATGTDSIAIGDQAVASGNFTVAIGEYATATTSYGISIGRGSEGGTSAIGIGFLGEAKGFYSIAIGRSANVNASAQQAVCIGASATASSVGDFSVNVGYRCQSVYAAQVNIGQELRNSTSPTTTDVNYSVKLGYNDGLPADKNILHLFSKGKLELYGDEAQFIFPNYAVTGSPIEVPANSIEGGVIYDSIAKGLQVYDGASWSAIGGGGGSVALNDLTDVNATGSPLVANQVLTFDGTNWVNAGNTGEANKNWITADNGDNFANAPSATGVNALAIGDNAFAGAGAGAIAIGENANCSASSTGGIAIGRNADINNGNGNLIIGNGVETNGYSVTNSIAIGNQAKTTALVTVSLGYKALAYGSMAVVIGRQCATRSAQDVVIGAYCTTTATASAGHNVVIGARAETSASVDRSVVIGDAANAELSKQISIGYLMDAVAIPTTGVAHSVKIGSGDASNINILHLYSKGKLELHGDEAQFIFPNYLVGSPATPAIPSTTVEGGAIWDASTKELKIYDGTAFTAVGAGGSVALNDLTDVIVAGSPAVTDQVLAFDGTNWVNSTPGVVNNWITGNSGADFSIAPSAGTNALAGGRGASAGGTRSIAFGYNANAVGGDSIVMGFYATANQTGCISIGDSSDATTTQAIAIGDTAQSKAIGTIAIGHNATANANLSVVIGRQGRDNSTGSGRNIVIGPYNTIPTGAGDNHIIIGNSSDVVVGMYNCIVQGKDSIANLTYQTVIGANLSSANVTTDVAYSVKLGTREFSSDTNLNMLHLFSKGKLELYGSEAQFVFPNYQSGSPSTIPATTVEGGGIWDSTTKELKIYDGTTFTAIGGAGGSVALNDLTDVTLGSPVTNEVLTYDGANWINAGSTGEVNKNWIHADNGNDFGIAPLGTGTESISIGNNANTNTATNAIAIGNAANTGVGNGGIALGDGADIFAGIENVVIGDGAHATVNTLSQSISIGRQANVTQSGAVAIGHVASAYGVFSIAMGRLALSFSPREVIIGAYAKSGSTVTAGRNVVIGSSSQAADTVAQSVAIGDTTKTEQNFQVSIGNIVDATKITTTDVAHSVKIGSGVAANINILHLYSKGKLELVGDEAQFVFPNYAAGSPATLPANSVVGGVIYDSVANGLQVYGGSPAGWSAIGGAGGGVTDHTLLTNIGTNTHAQIDTHISALNPHNNWISVNADVLAGVDATSTSLGTAIGSDTQAGNGSFAAGNNCAASALSCIAIGSNVTTNTGNSIGLGAAMTLQRYAIGMGRNVTAAQSSVSIGDLSSADGSAGVAVGTGADAFATNSIALGAASDVAVTATESIAIGRSAKSELGFQVVIGSNLDGASITTNETFSTKIGYGTPGSSLSVLHLMSKGKLELYGDEAQFVFPNYQSGSPITTTIPSTTIEGGAIWDSSTKELKIYDGAAFTAIGGGGGGATALNDLSDVVVSGSPAVTNQVLTFDGTNWVNADTQPATITLDDLTDVTITTPAEGSILAHNGAGQFIDVDVGANGTLLLANSGAAGGVEWGSLSTVTEHEWIHCAGGGDFGVVPVSSATGTDAAIAIGDGATATAFATVGIGRFANATFDGCVAIGESAKANTGTDAVAIGVSSSANNTAVAVGNSCLATVTRCIAIGSQAKANNGTQAIAIGRQTHAYGTNSIVFGAQAESTVAGAYSIVIGKDCNSALSRQVVIGSALVPASTTVDVAESVKLGFYSATVPNFLHLFNDGKLELYGDEAMYIVPKYAAGTVANGQEGGMIYDSTAKKLKVHDGSVFQDVHGSLNDLTDVVIGGSPLLTDDVLTYDGANWINKPPSNRPSYEIIDITGSPVSAAVTTTVSTIAASGNPFLAGLMVFRNGAQQTEGVMEGSPLEPSRDFAVTGANEITFTTGILEAGNVINIYVFE